LATNLLLKEIILLPLGNGQKQAMKKATHLVEEQSLRVLEAMLLGVQVLILQVL